MVIIVHSTESKSSIVANMGTKDYSYYFVLEKYRKVLNRFATVVEIRNPESEVDAIYTKCRQTGEPCLFLSFTPPFKTTTELKCPTICVFAWEYLTLPTDEWGGDLHNDWRNVLSKHGRAITHSGFAVRSVEKAMGKNFPVWSIPAPVWDDCTKFYSGEFKSPCSKGFDLYFEGVVVDFQGCSLSNDHQANFVEKRSDLKENDTVTVHLAGVIYTAIFNPNDGRKNWPDLLWGFCWAFRDVEDATLVMKLAYYDYDMVRDMVVNEIMKLAPFKCRIIVLHGYLNEEIYAELIKGTTYVVNTAHGEGQCLPLMEYMSAGIPAVAPGHTAMEDYINLKNAFVVASSLEWIPWPHDPRHVFRTFRYRINWESLLRAYLESYNVAKNDPARYMLMSRNAVDSLQKYCSKAIAEERLKTVLQACGMFSEGWLIATIRKVWRWQNVSKAHILPSHILKAHQWVKAKLRMERGKEQ